ncbi:hypothetical protein vseg_004202 [Gypsophila vaccaria]
MEGSDIVFNVAGEKFHAHKLVLSARSCVFRSEFQEISDEGKEEMVITDMEPRVFKAMLHFVYRDTLMDDEGDEPLMPFGSSCESPISEWLITRVLAAADKYGLDRLRQLCESSLCQKIDVSTVGEILALADCHHAAELKGVCLRYAAENLAV